MSLLCLTHAISHFQLPPIGKVMSSLQLDSSQGLYLLPTLAPALQLLATEGNSQGLGQHSCSRGPSAVTVLTPEIASSQRFAAHQAHCKTHRFVQGFPQSRSCSAHNMPWRYPTSNEPRLDSNQAERRGKVWACCHVTGESPSQMLLVIGQKVV